MCGRYVATQDADGLIERFEILDDRDPRGREARVRWSGTADYNVAPTDTVPAVVSHEGQRILTGFRWGLVPFWAKDPKIGARMINARSETITSKNAFAESFRLRRCLLPADGFYEWERADGQKLPWFVRRTDDDLMVFAGLWASWRPAGSDEEKLLSCTVITTEANDVLSGIHDRMPVILDRDQQAAWLQPDAEEPDLLRLLAPAPDGAVERYRVSTRVNSVRNNEASLLEPVAADETASQVSVGPLAADDAGSRTGSGSVDGAGVDGGAEGAAQPSLFD